MMTMEKAQARAKGTSLPISPKTTFMVCQHLRGKTLARAKAILEAVTKEKESVPFTRFTNGVGHRRGKVGPGRFPLKASEHLLTLLKSAEANATDLGMGSELFVKEIRANRASAPMRQGRQARRVFKRTHVYVTLEEAEAKKRPAPKKAPAKQTPKKAAAKTTKQEEEQ